MGELWLRTCINDLLTLTVSVHGSAVEAEAARHNGFCCTTKPIRLGEDVVLVPGKVVSEQSRAEKAKPEDSFAVDLSFLPKQKPLKL